MIEAFQRSHLCRYLNREEIQEFVTLGEIHELKTGQPLFAAGDPGDTLYAILSGRIEVVSVLEGGQHKTLAVLDFGDVIGESALIDREPRSAAAICAEDAKLWELSRSGLIRMIREKPRVAAKFMWALLESLTVRMRNANATQAQLMDKLQTMSRAQLD